MYVLCCIYLKLYQRFECEILETNLDKNLTKKRRFQRGTNIVFPCVTVKTLKTWKERKRERRCHNREILHQELLHIRYYIQECHPWYLSKFTWPIVMKIKVWEYAPILIFCQNKCRFSCLKSMYSAFWNTLEYSSSELLKIFVSQMSYLDVLFTHSVQVSQMLWKILNSIRCLRLGNWILC